MSNITDLCSPAYLNTQDQHAFPRVSHGTLIAWLFFNISASQFLLPILVAALYFTKPKSPPTLINVVLTWILYGLVSSILLYSGHALDHCEPPPLLCLAQASLYISLPPMVLTAIFCAIFQIWLDVRQKLHQSLEEQDHTIRRVCLLVAPYIIYCIFATMIAAIGASNFTHTVSRTRRTFYCSVRAPLLTNTVIGFCSIIGLVALFFAVWTAIMLRQNWVKLNRSVNSRLDYSYIFRMIGFLLYLVLAFGMALLPKKALVVSDMFMSLTGYVVLFVFATRRIVLQVFMTRFNYFYQRNSALENRAADKMHIVSV